MGGLKTEDRGRLSVFILISDFLPDRTSQWAPLRCLFAMVTACEFACLCHIHTLPYLELSAVDLKALCIIIRVLPIENDALRDLVAKLGT